MKRYIVIIFILCSSAWATDTYFAQAAAGGGTGANCANAKAVSGWASSFGAGNTQHLCGTITSELTAGGAGASGNPDIVVFETGATITVAACDSSGCFSFGGNNWVTLNGGTACGWNTATNAAEGTCNGSILTTASGSAFGGGTTGYGVTGCGNNDVIENMNIGPIYVHTINSATFPTSQNGIQCGGGITLTVEHSTLANAQWFMVDTYTTGDTLILLNNWFHDSGHEVALAGGVNNGSVSVTITGNRFTTNGTWDGSGCPEHLDGIHFYSQGANPSAITGTVNNNIFDQTDGVAITCLTAHTFFDANEKIGAAGIIFFNNLYFFQTSITSGDALFTAGPLASTGAISLYNNTFVCASSGAGPEGALLNYITYKGKNNLYKNCSALVDSCSVACTTPPTFPPLTLDYNAYDIATCTSAGNGCFRNFSLAQYNTLPTWRTATGQEAHSQGGATNLSASYKPNAGSSAIGNGVNLTSLGITALDSDLAGNARSSSAAWDIGAYEVSPIYTITISSIFGSGTVTSSDSVINCTTGTTGTCVDSTASNTVTLTAAPGSGYTFTGWGGGTCSGGALTCGVTTTATVTATFTPLSSNVGSGSGSGNTTAGTGGGSGITTFGILPVKFRGYTGQNPVAPTTFPNWGGQTNNGLIWTDTSYPSGTAASVQRCVDGNTLSDKPNFVLEAGRGGASQGTIFVERTSQFTLLQDTGGTTFGLQLNPSAGSCTTNVIKQNYSVICPTTHGLNTCSATTTLNFNEAYWSKTQNGVLYSIGSTDATTGIKGEVLKYTINVPGSSPNNCISIGTGAGCYSYTAIAHMVNALPYGAAVSAWQPNTNYGFGAYISSQPTPTTWQASTATYALGDLVEIPGCSYFKVTVIGTTGAAPPNWAAHCSDTSAFTDGTVTWRGLESETFIQQCITATGCVSGSSAPSFLNGTATTQMPGGHPDMAAITNDATGQWQNSGLNGVIVWTDFGGMGLNENLITWAASGNTYGIGPNRYGGPSAFNGGQDSGSWAMVYNISQNYFRLFNTLTNMITQINCVGGSGIDCTGGTWTPTTLGQSNAPCSASMHEISNTYGTIATVGNLYIAGPSCNIGKRFWNEAQTTFNSSTVAPISPWNINHWTTTNNYMSNWNANGWSDTTHGIWNTYSLLSNASSLNPPANLVIGSINCSPTPPFIFPPCSGVGHIDTHTDSAYNPDGDFDPVMGTGVNSDASDTIGPDMAWQGEFIIITTTPTTTSPGGGPVGTVFREGHVCGWDTNPKFSLNVCISHNSQDGRFAFVSSDCFGTCGSTDGTPPTCCGTGANQLAVPYVPAFGDPATVTCQGGRTWIPSNPYVVGNMIQPENSSANATTFNVFQMTACSGTSCTSGTTKPSFGTVTGIGQTILDPPTGPNQITWTNVGNGNCMGTVLMLTLK